MSGKLKQSLYRGKHITTKTEAAELLRKLADQLDAGEITLQDTPYQIPEQVKFELELEKKVKKGTEKTELEIEISWPAESPVTF